MTSKATKGAQLVTLLALVSQGWARGTPGLSTPLGPLDSPPAPQQQVVRLITQAIEDEIAAAVGYDIARMSDCRSYENLFFAVEGGQEVLVEPFHEIGSGSAVRVLYRLPEFGWVVREAAVYPEPQLAIFWLGYAQNGPGTNTGFNCTHALSNCKLQDLDLGFVRQAFTAWWLAHYQPLLATMPELGAELQRAKARNEERLRVRLKWLAEH